MGLSVFRLTSALKVSVVHFIISIIIAGLAAALIFGIWYRWPFSEMLGGRELFWLIVGVDVVSGPILTLVLWNPNKSRRELIQDVSLIIFLQAGALFYGVYTVAIARPVHLVFEVDRIRIVTASEIEASELLDATEGLRTLPWAGPTLISVRDPISNDELLKSVEQSMSGKEPSLRPSWWQSYGLKVPQILVRAKSLDALVQARPDQKYLIDVAVKKSGMPASELLWLPVTSAKSMEWVVFIEKSEGKPLAYAPIDGFL